MSLAEYLAKNYLTPDTPSNNTTDLSTRPKKKRKKTKPTAEEQPAGLIIADDDDPLSIRTPSSAFNSKNGGRNDDPDDENPLTVTGPNPSAEFRRAKKNAWKKVGGGGGGGGGKEQAEADAIVASAAAEAREKGGNDEGEDAPAMVSGGEDDDEGEGLRMESGAKAGLQTAAQTAEMVKAMERKKRKEAAKNKEKGKAEEETIYRDASGRVINVAMKRAEARRIADEEAEKEAAAKEALKGDVQRKEKERRKEELEEAKVMPLARRADDEDLNEQLKARERWNDPAAEFLTSTTTASVGGASRPLKPVYKGAAPPNRYGIRPGYRWDGVDRGNGFESEWFGARNKKERIGALEYAWQMDE